MEYINHYDSPLGGLTLASNGNFLTGLWFDGQIYFADNLEKEHEEKNLPVFKKTREWLDIYFSGKEPDFTPPLLMKTTSFRKSVWRILLKIPYGEIMTYGEIAEKLKTSSRAVGGAVARNSISIIIPCHRVLGANENLTGYSAGIDKKEKLLKLERGEKIS